MLQFLAAVARGPAQKVEVRVSLHSYPFHYMLDVVSLFTMTQSEHWIHALCVPSSAAAGRPKLTCSVDAGLLSDAHRENDPDFHSNLNPDLRCRS